MKRLLALALFSALLAGCVVVPAEHYNYGGDHWEHRYDGDRDFRYQDHG
jgi:hypothetical protein